MLTSTMPSAINSLAGLYRACGTLGNEGMPGAPVVEYSLLVDPMRGTVTGIVHITQAIEGPESGIRVDVTGTMHELVWGADVSKVVVLSGTYSQACPPPELCVVQRQFTAHMLLDNGWSGRGGFTYGDNRRVENVPVKSTDC